MFLPTGWRFVAVVLVIELLLGRKANTCGGETVIVVVVLLWHPLLLLLQGLNLRLLLNAVLHGVRNQFPVAPRLHPGGRSVRIRIFVLG